MKASLKEHLFHAAETYRRISLFVKSYVSNWSNVAPRFSIVGIFFPENHLYVVLVRKEYP